MKVGDTKRTTNGRKFLNTQLIPKIAGMLEDGNEVLFVGTDTAWDYKPFFWNPARQCVYITLDISSQYHPDIVSSIEECPMIPDGKFHLIMYIGMWENVHDNQKALKEMKRMLAQEGYLLVAFPGRGYRDENWAVEPNQVYDILSEFRVLEQYCLYEGEPKPSSICVLAQKI